jgi:hypothetical protein
MSSSLPKFIHDQTLSLDVNPEKPLILVDADEVIVHFALPLKDYLSEFGFDLNFTSYKIFDNITEQKTGAILPREKAVHFIDKFFDDRVFHQPAVAGAVAALNDLSTKNQVIIVTNVPQKAKDTRKQAMVKLGMDFPLIANKGLKGPIIQYLTKDHQAPVVFLDDIPHNLQSVKAEAPHVHRIHFVAEPILRPLLEKAKGAHVRIDEWDDCHRYINNHFKEQGF